jgi:hypothetical protein
VRSIAPMWMSRIAPSLGPPGTGRAHTMPLKAGMHPPDRYCTANALTRKCCCEWRVMMQGYIVAVPAATLLKIFPRRERLLGFACEGVALC